MGIEEIKKSRRFVESARRLVKGRYVLRSDNQQAFEAIEDLQIQLNEYFSLLGAELVLEASAGVARLIEVQDLDYQVSFAAKKTLNPQESLICLFLRQRRHEHITGKDIITESVVVSEDDIWNFCLAFNSQKIAKRFRTDVFDVAISSLKEKQILSQNSDGTYTVTPVCDIIIPHDLVSSYLEEAKKYFSSRIAKEYAE